LFVVKAHAAANDVVVAVPPGYAPANSVVVATRNERDLVSYLISLKQQPLPSPAP
jgi:cytochrome c oxidase cbb3-type subunit 2